MVHLVQDLSACASFPFAVQNITDKQGWQAEMQRLIDKN